MEDCRTALLFAQQLQNEIIALYETLHDAPTTRSFFFSFNRMYFLLQRQSLTVPLPRN